MRISFVILAFTLISCETLNSNSSTGAAGSDSASSGQGKKGTFRHSLFGGSTRSGGHVADYNAGSKSKTKAQLALELIDGQSEGYHLTAVNRAPSQMEDAVEAFMTGKVAVPYYQSNSRAWKEYGKFDVAQTNMCTSAPGDLDATYNNSDARGRANFMYSLTACLAASESGAYWTKNSKYDWSMRDRYASSSNGNNRKYVHGLFQLDQAAKTSDRYPLKVSMKYGNMFTCAEVASKTSGTRVKASNLEAVVSSESNQGFNIHCAVQKLAEHALYQTRAQGKSCWDPFYSSVNKFGPLKRKSPSLVSCVRTLTRNSSSLSGKSIRRFRGDLVDAKNGGRSDYIVEGGDRDERYDHGV